MNVKAYLLIFLMLGSVLYLVPQTNAVSSGMHIEGPTVAATNTTVTYKVSITTFFDKYKCTLLIGGQNLTGASPVNQIMKNSTTGEFVFDVKTPDTPQRIYLDFKAYGIMNNSGNMKIFERVVYLDVKKTYMVVADLKNSEPYTVYNVTVNFYVDGKFIGNTTVKKIESNSSAKAVYHWVPDVSDGPHKIEMKVVAKGVVFPNGQQSYSREIYIGKPPNYDWVGYVSIAGAAALGILFLFMFFGRKKGHESKPKWKKS
ncbi:MAG: CARDB domain-containing protein [Euryarchaeota archaeon]|nr:CARDB domain-containing protein [Euryarchaeota archaeon]